MMSPNPFIDRAVEALTAFGVTDRVAAAPLLDMWRHRAELSTDEAGAVLMCFPLPGADDPYFWCEAAPGHELCAERAEHRSPVVRVGADVLHASALITLMMVALIDKPPHRDILGVFMAVTEEGRRIPHLLPLDQAAALYDELGHLLRVAGVRP